MNVIRTGGRQDSDNHGLFSHVAFRGRKHALHSVCWSRIVLIQIVSCNSVPFRASELTLPQTSECLGMSTFFRGITETVPSLFPEFLVTKFRSQSQPYLKGHGNEPVFPMFLHKSVRHGSLTVPFEPFRF
jgi:hypothetical protein